MDWRQDRLEVPVAWGRVRLAERPDALAPVRIIGGRAEAFELAAETLSLFEHSVTGVDAGLNLGDIDVREGPGFFSGSVPRCPVPAHNQIEGPPTFRSLGVRVLKNFFYEYWYFVRVFVNEAGFSWRLEWALRTRPEGILLRRGLQLSLLPLFWGMITTGNGEQYLLVAAAICAFLYTIKYTMGYTEVAEVLREGREATYLSTVKHIWVDALETMETQFNPQAGPPVSSGPGALPTFASRAARAGIPTGVASSGVTPTQNTPSPKKQVPRSRP